MTADQDRQVSEMMEETFENSWRDKRSPEYQEGTRAWYGFVVAGAEVTCPHEAATAQADAFWAGLDEGKSRITSGGQKKRLEAYLGETR